MLDKNFSKEKFLLYSNAIKSKDWMESWLPILENENYKDNAINNQEEAWRAHLKSIEIFVKENHIHKYDRDFAISERGEYLRKEDAIRYIKSLGLSVNQNNLISCENKKEKHSDAREKHSSELLSVLDDTIEQWWKTYDPSNKNTAPQKKTSLSG